MDRKRRVLVKASIKGKIVGYTQWAALGMDDTFCPTGDSFTDRFKAQTNRTRAGLLGDSTYWYLAILVVDSNHWGTGIGRKLLKFGHEQAKQQDGTPLQCFLEASLMAERFYIKFGYRLLG